MKSMFGLFNFLLGVKKSDGEHLENKSESLSNTQQSYDIEQIANQIAQQMQQSKPHGKVLKILREYVVCAPEIFKDERITMYCTPTILCNLGINLDREKANMLYSGTIQGNLGSMTNQLIFLSNQLSPGRLPFVANAIFEKWCFLMKKRMKLDNFKALKKHTRYLMQIHDVLDRRCDDKTRVDNARISIDKLTRQTKKSWLRSCNFDNGSTVLLWYKDFLCTFPLDKKDVFILTSQDHNNAYRVAFVKVISLLAAKRLSLSKSAENVLQQNITLVGHRYHILAVSRETELMQSLMRRVFNGTMEEINLKHRQHREISGGADNFTKVVACIDADLVAECVMLHIIRVTFVDRVLKKKIAYSYEDVSSESCVKCDLGDKVESYIELCLPRESHTKGLKYCESQYILSICYFLMQQWSSDKITNYISSVQDDIVDYIPKGLTSLLWPRFQDLCKSVSAQEHPTQKISLNSDKLWEDFQQVFSSADIRWFNDIKIELYNVVDGIKIEQPGEDHGGITRHVLEGLSQHIKDNIDLSNILALSPYDTYYLRKKRGATQKAIDQELRELANFLAFSAMTRKNKIINMEFEEATLESIAHPDFLKLQLHSQGGNIFLPIFDKDTQDGLAQAGEEHGELLEIALEYHKEKYQKPAQSLARQLHQLIRDKIIFINYKSLKAIFQKCEVPSASEIVNRITFRIGGCQKADYENRQQLMKEKFVQILSEIEPKERKRFLLLMNGSFTRLKCMTVYVEDDNRWPQWRSCFNKMSIGIHFNKQQLLDAMEYASTCFNLL